MKKKTLQRGNIESAERNFNILIEKNKNKKAYVFYYSSTLSVYSLNVIINICFSVS